MRKPLFCALLSVLSLSLAALPPSIRILGAPASTELPSIQIQVEATARDGGIGPLEVYLNGLLYAVDGSRGIQVRAKEGAILSRTVRLDLPQGSDEVLVVAYDAARKESASSKTRIQALFRDWDFGERYPPAYDAMSAARLLAASLDTPSATERRMMRGYLAMKWPRSAEGCFGRSLLVPTKEAIPLLEEAIRLDPRLAPAYNNLVADYQELKATEKERRVSRGLLAAVPDYDSYNFVRVVYFETRDDRGQKAADDFLAGWKGRLGPDHPIFAEIEGIAAEERKNYRAAEAGYSRATASGQAPLRVFKDLLDVRLDVLLASASEQERLAALAEFLRGAVAMPQAKDRYTGIMAAADRMMNDFKDRTQAVALYNAAYQAYPAGEAMEQMVQRGGSYWRAQLLPLLAEASARLPCNAAVARAIAYDAVEYGDELGKAEEWLIKAVQYSHTAADRQAAIGKLGELYEDRLCLHDKAKKLYLSSADIQQDKAALYYRLYLNRLTAMDFHEAQAYLELYTPYVKDESWYQKQRQLLLSLIDGEAERPRSEIVISSFLRSEQTAVSPDGATLACGGSPMSLWSVGTGLKLRDLGPGGRERAFSPDGKMVATVAEQSGYFVLYVYEVATGRRIMARPHYWKAEGLCWSPDSARVAFADAVGVANVFDVVGRRNAATFRTGEMRISGPMAWSKGGLIVCGQAQSKKVTVRSGADYSVVKVLGGVDWPHAVGATCDGQFVLCSDNRMQMTVWDCGTWQARSAPMPFGSKHILPHPTRPLVLLDRFTDSADEHAEALALFDPARRQGRHVGPPGAHRGARRLYARREEVAQVDLRKRLWLLPRP
jgi:hypothetical protein